MLSKWSQLNVERTIDARMGEERKVYNEVYLEDQGVDGRMGSEWILGRLAGGV
jgi:hypothetical protein